jgi:hypothetical protein
LLSLPPAPRMQKSDAQLWRMNLRIIPLSTVQTVSLPSLLPQPKLSHPLPLWKLKPGVVQESVARMGGSSTLAVPARIAWPVLPHLQAWLPVSSPDLVRISTKSLRTICPWTLCPAKGKESLLLGGKGAPKETCHPRLTRDLVAAQALVLKSLRIRRLSRS